MPEGKNDPLVVLVLMCVFGEFVSVNTENDCDVSGNIQHKPPEPWRDANWALQHDDMPAQIFSELSERSSHKNIQAELQWGWEQQLCSWAWRWHCVWYHSSFLMCSSYHVWIGVGRYGLKIKFKIFSYHIRFWFYINFLFKLQKTKELFQIHCFYFKQTKISLLGIKCKPSFNQTKPFF